MNRTGLFTRRGMWIALGVCLLAGPALVVGQHDAGEMELPEGLEHPEQELPDLDVPYVPTNQAVVDEMLKLAKVTKGDFVMDLGCGDGRIVVTAAKTYGCRAMGVDLDPQRISESKENAAQAGVTELVTFEVADIFKTDVRRANVVTLFLLETVNVQLRPRLFAQLAPGTRVISNGFTMRDWKQDEFVKHPDAYGLGIYRWVIPAPAGGVWKWQSKVGEQDIPGMVTLSQQFQVVRGSVRMGRIGERTETPIAEPVLSGKELSFTATVAMGENKVVVAFKGTVEGDAIKGTQEWRGGPNAGTYPWQAKRDPVQVVGRWAVDSPTNAAQKGTLRIERKEEQVTAVYVRDSEKDKEIPLPGFYVWGSSVRFEVPNGYDPLVFSGVLEGGLGRGAVSKAESADRPGEWQAKRIPD